MSGVGVFNELTRAELRERVGSIIVLPLGATEQHGDHLPVMTDAAIVTAIAQRVCARVGQSTPVLLAPTVAVGISGHHLPFGGTLSVSSESYIHALVDTVTALRAQGFARTFFLNGHGGNDASMRVAIERLALTAREGQAAAGMSYWHVIESALPARPEFPVPGHAGAFETSIMLALHPELVHLDRAPFDQGPFPLATRELSGIADGRPADWRASDGRTDGPVAASAEFGEHALDAISGEVALRLLAHVRLLDDRAAESIPGSTA